jgi:HK97 gp10 family phage protein
MADESGDAINVEISNSIEDFRFSYIGLQELLRGPVLADLVKRAIRVEAAAKDIARATPPSHPGGGPAVRTGRLRGSITWRASVDSFSPYVDVGTSVYYAPYVELGTSKMKARPFLRPALERARASF